MPYIKKETRDLYSEEIEKLHHVIDYKGDLNYVISELVGKLILRTGMSYTNASEWIDAVHDAECELRRRLLDPYEDIKIMENGDVPSFKEIIDSM